MTQVAQLAIYHEVSFQIVLLPTRIKENLPEEEKAVPLPLPSLLLSFFVLLQVRHKRYPP